MKIVKAVKNAIIPKHSICHLFYTNIFEAVLVQNVPLGSGFSTHFFICASTYKVTKLAISWGPCQKEQLMINFCYVQHYCWRVGYVNDLCGVFFKYFCV